MPASSVTRTLGEMAGAWPAVLPGKFDMTAAYALSAGADTVWPGWQQRIVASNLSGLWHSVVGGEACKFGGPGGPEGSEGQLAPLQMAHHKIGFPARKAKGLICMGDKANSAWNCAYSTLHPVLQKAPANLKAGLPCEENQEHNMLLDRVPPVLQALYEPLPPGEAPRPGDVCLFGGHIGTVVDSLDGWPIIYGKDGFYGTFAGLEQQWGSIYPGPRRYCRLKEDVRQALGPEHPVVAEYRQRAHRLGIDVPKELRRWLESHPDQAVRK
jgi:hypothetical protein